MTLQISIGNIRIQSTGGSPPVVPVYVSSTIENATPVILEMTYDLALADVVPATSAFAVLVNAVARTVNSVAIVAGKVQLTLASAVIYGDTVTVAYTKPGSNPLQTAAGGQAVSITAQSVTNNAFSAEYYTAWSAMYLKPTGTIALEQDLLVRTLVSSGVWAKTDLFYLFAQIANDNGEALINWKNPGTFNATLGGGAAAPTFTAKVGFTGNASTQYIRTHYIPSSDHVNASLNSTAFSIGSTVLKSAGGFNIMGGVGATGADHFGTRWGDGNTYSWNNLGLVITPSSTTVGNWTNTRTASNVVNLYRNKTKTASTVASVAEADEEIYLLCRNTTGAQSFFSAETTNYFLFSSGLSQSEVESLSDSIDLYMANIVSAPTGLISAILTEQAFHTDYINGNYRFGWNATQVFYSSDGGSNWTTVAFADADLIENSVIFSNGNVWFSQKNKCWKSTDGLANITEVTVLDINGNPYTPVGSYVFYGKSATIDIFDVEGQEMCVWGNYTLNVIDINIYRMFNTCIPKITFTTTGHPTIIVKHFHGATYDSINKKFYVSSGDVYLVNTNTPILEGIYNNITDSFIWIAVPNTPPLSITAVLAGMICLNSILTYSIEWYKLYKCRIQDLSDFTKHTKLIDKTTSTIVLYYFCLENNGVGVCVCSGGDVIITKDGFITGRVYKFPNSFTGDSCKVQKISTNNYKVERFVPAQHYYHNSVFVALTDDV